MKHFGIISPPVAGHLNPFSALGRELIRRGHRVTVFHMADLESKLQAEGLEFCRIGESDHPLGTLRKTLAEIGRFSRNSGPALYRKCCGAKLGNVPARRPGCDSCRRR